MQGHAVNAHRVLGNRLCKPGHAWLPVDAPSGCQCVAESRPTGLLPGGLGAENRSTLQVVEFFGHIFPTVLQKTPRNKINHKKTQNKINHPVIFFGIAQHQDNDMAGFLTPALSAFPSRQEPVKVSNGPIRKP
jgi:hypothetical protein